MQKTRDPSILNAEAKEFHYLGDKRIAEIWDSIKDVGDGNPMLAGYLLGLETARVLLSMSPKAAQVGISDLI